MIHVHLIVADHFNEIRHPGRMNTDCSHISYFVSDFIHVVKYFMKYLT